MNVGSFFKHENRTSDTDRWKGFFFTARVPQANVITMERNVEQRSELQVAKCLIVHVLSSCFIVSSFELSNKQTATQQWKRRVTNNIVLNQDGVYPTERVYASNAVCKFWFVKSLVSQDYSKFFANISSGNVSQFRTNKCKTRSFNFKVIPYFLPSSTCCNCDSAFAVIVFFWNENVLGFNNVRSGRVKSRFQKKKF